PELTDEEVGAVLEKVKKAIAKPGQVLKTDLWGKRKLAYPLDKLIEGIYAVLEFETEPDRLLSLNQMLRRDEDVVRFMVTNL
ncbi:30S ribosomal protein S6, partial [Candidatus Parcubacteria bacterium]|nr:30S ribosomal protein S6 [Candidatus Parcubacteria bacterium]